MGLTDVEDFRQFEIASTPSIWATLNPNPRSHFSSAQPTVEELIFNRSFIAARKRQLR